MGEIRDCPEPKRSVLYKKMEQVQFEMLERTEEIT